MYWSSVVVIQETTVLVRAIRHGAKSVLRLEMMSEPPLVRADSNPWPEWPLVKKTDYGQEENIAVFGEDPRVYNSTVKRIYS